MYNLLPARSWDDHAVRGVGQRGGEDLDREAAEVLDGPIQGLVALPHGTRLGMTREVLRVRSRAATAIVKVTYANAASMANAGSIRNPLRELAVYQNGLPRSFSENEIELPRLLGSYIRPNGDVSLWLEDVGEPEGARSFTRHVTRLGRAQALALSGGWESEWIPWTKNFARQYMDTMEDLDWGLVPDPAAWEHPTIRAFFRGDFLRDVQRLCLERYDLEALTRRLPQTLCHHDFWEGNLSERGGATILLDWAFAGDGPLGLDVGNLVAASVLVSRGTSVANFTRMERVLFAAYSKGVRDIGVARPLNLARLGLCGTAAKWAWIVPSMLTEVQLQRGLLSYLGEPVALEQYVRQRAALCAVLVRWANEAKDL